MPQPRHTDAPNCQQPSGAAVGISELLAAVVRKHYNPIENPKDVDGAQMWNGQWWMPLWGCDTLENMLDDMAYAIERQQAANNMSTEQKTLGEIAHAVINGLEYPDIAKEHWDKWADKDLWERAAQAVRQHVLETETEEGWRLVKFGEPVQTGDEYQCGDGSWMPVASPSLSYKHIRRRRRFLKESHAQDESDRDAMAAQQQASATQAGSPACGSQPQPEGGAIVNPPYDGGISPAPEGPTPKGAYEWYCPTCRLVVPANEVTFENKTHDKGNGGCGNVVEFRAVVQPPEPPSQSCGNGLRSHHLLHLHAADLIRMAESAQKWREVAEKMQCELTLIAETISTTEADTLRDWAKDALAAYNELVKEDA